MSSESAAYVILLTSSFKLFLSLIRMNLILSNHTKIVKRKRLKSYLKRRERSTKQNFELSESWENSIISSYIFKVVLAVQNNSQTELEEGSP